MAEQIDSLLVSLGLDTDKQSFDNGVSMFNGLRSSAMALAGALGVGVGGASLTTGFANSRQELGNFSRQMQVSAQDVRGLEFAFSQVGGEASEARSAIEGMVRFQDALRRGESGAFDAMSMLGLDPRAVTDAQDATQAIERVMQAMQGMDDQQRRIILQDMGINSPAAFKLFGQGAQALDDYMARAAELAPVTQEQIDLANEFNESLSEFKTAIEGVTNVLAADLLPDLTRFSNWATDFLLDNDSKISEFFNEGPEAFGRKYGEDLRDNISEWLDGINIRRGQGQDSQTLRESLQGRQGPPGIPDFDIRRGQSIRDNEAYRAAVAQAEKDIGAPAGLLWAQIGQESSYNPYAVSGAGARGLGQIMPNTEVSLEKRFGEELDPFDPMDSLKMQQELMHENFKNSGDWDEALRLYHGGYDRSAWGPVNEAYAPSVRERMQSEGGSNPQASANTQYNTFNINGGDTAEVERVVTRVIRNHSEQAADAFRSSVV